MLTLLSVSRRVFLPVGGKLLAQPDQHAVQPAYHIWRVVNVRFEHLIMSTAATSRSTDAAMPNVDVPRGSLVDSNLNLAYAWRLLRCRDAMADHP